VSLALAAVPLLASLACGGNRPAEQAPPPAASAPAAAAALAEPAAPPADDPVAQAAPPAARPVEKPTARPAPKPASRPAPPPAPKPEPIVKTVPAGTEIIVELVDGASSQTSQVGNTVRARVTRAVVIDGLTVIPDGSIVNGTVTEAIPVKKIGGTASLGLRFDSLDLSGGRKTAIAASLRQQGKSEDGKDAGTIAGATAGGALLGRLLSKNDKTKGTLIGAAVGAAAGTGIAAGTKGQEVALPVGTTLALQIEQPLTISVQP
jgi:hypothetical protein